MRERGVELVKTTSQPTVKVAPRESGIAAEQKIRDLMRITFDRDEQEDLIDLRVVRGRRVA